MPARRELALQALQFALDVMLRIQEPSAAFLASPGLTKLPAVASLARSEPNRDALREAGALRRMSELLLHSD